MKDDNKMNELLEQRSEAAYLVKRLTVEIEELQERQRNPAAKILEDLGFKHIDDGGNWYELERAATYTKGVYGDRTVEASLFVNPIDRIMDFNVCHVDAGDVHLVHVETARDLLSGIIHEAELLCKVAQITVVDGRWEKEERNLI